MTKEEKYIDLRDRLTSISCSDNKLNILKEHFKILIDSDRRFDRINNLRSLIIVLEKRDVISPNNINHVAYIANELQSYEVIEMINDFNTPPQARPVIQNADILIPNIGLNNNVNNNNNSRVLPVTDPDPVRRVYDLICREIGQKWKELARALKISEGFIDQLEYKHKPNVQEMVREIITYHRENCDPQYWRQELLDALIDARRRDLNIAVHRIFCYA